MMTYMIILENESILKFGISLVTYVKCIKNIGKLDAI